MDCETDVDMKGFQWVSHLSFPAPLATAGTRGSCGANRTIGRGLCEDRTSPETSQAWTLWKKEKRSAIGPGQFKHTLRRCYVTPHGRFSRTSETGGGAGMTGPDNGTRAQAMTGARVGGK